MRRLPFLILLTVLLASCAVQSPFVGEEQYFQALGEEGALVVTADVGRVQGSQFSSLLASVDERILSRSDRISLSMTPEGSGWVIEGAAEGDFPRSLVSSALDWSRSYEKAGDYIYQARDGSMGAAIPRNGLMLFSESDILTHRERTWADRVLRIDFEIARQMAQAQAAIYSVRPVSVPSFAFDLPQSVVDRTEAFLLLLDDRDGRAYISGWMKLDSQSSARALLTLLRNELVKAVKERGERLETKLLAGYFQSDGDTVRLDFPVEVFQTGKGE